MKRQALIIFGLIAITVAAFWNVGRCGFVNFDDDVYVYNNPHVYTGISVDNVRWAWTTFQGATYHPLTWLSLMLDASMFGRRPGGFHWVNLAFHSANVVLVYLFCERATGCAWRSALLAAIFAVHPLRVESVAWITERKDVLCYFLGLTAMLTYLRYTRTLEWKFYVATLFLYGASLLAKQALATLPCLLLLLDYWPLGRLRIHATRGNSKIVHSQSLLRLIIEKLPLFMIAAAISVLAVKGQQAGGALISTHVLPLSRRLSNVPVSYVRYLWKMVWFGDLVVFYPPEHWNSLQIITSCTLLAVITAFCCRKARSRPWLIVGWLWFLGTLVPMIQIIQFGSSSMADRFVYFSSLGVLLMVVWSIPESISHNRTLFAGIVVTLLGILMIFTIKQTEYWRDGVSLFTHDIAVTGSNVTDEKCLGEAFSEHDTTLPQALVHLRIAEKFAPRDAGIQSLLALALAYTRQLGEALPHAKLAVSLENDNASRHVLLAYILEKSKHYQEAAEESDQAIHLDPNSSEAHRVRGTALGEAGQIDEGIRELNTSLAINPQSRPARDFLNRLLIEKARSAPNPAAPTTFPTTSPLLH